MFYLTRDIQSHTHASLRYRKSFLKQLKVLAVPMTAQTVVVTTRKDLFKIDKPSVEHRHTTLRYSQRVHILVVLIVVHP